MRLWELTEEREKLEQVINECVDPETGELSDELAAQLDDLEMARDDKILGTGGAIKGMLAEAEAVHVVERDLKRRRQILERQAVRLTAYLERNLDVGETHKDERVIVGWNPGKVEVLEEDALPEEYRREKVSWEPDKMKIKADIKGGKIVPGAIIKRSVTVK